MNILYVAWMYAGKIFLKDNKFRDLTWENLTKLACYMQNSHKISVQKIDSTRQNFFSNRFVNYFTSIKQY